VELTELTTLEEAVDLAKTVRALKDVPDTDTDTDTCLCGSKLTQPGWTGNGGDSVSRGGVRGERELEVNAALPRRRRSPVLDQVHRLHRYPTTTQPSFLFVFATWPALRCCSHGPCAHTPALDNIAITIRALGSAIEVTPDFDSLFVFTRHLRSLYEHLNYEDDSESDASSS
jgi:hypothetical protein